MMASHFGPQPLALPGYHYRAYGRFCALPSRSALGGTARLSWRVRGHWCPPQRFLVADVCGTANRCDLPVGTFAAIYGPGWERAGVFPIRLLGVTRCRHHKVKHAAKHHRPVVTRIGTAWRGGYGQ